MKSKFIIKNVTMVNTWCYNLKFNNECTICRCNLNTNSIYTEENGIDSTVVSGICDHSYHYECINSWVKLNNNCPICLKKWTYAK